MDICVVLGSKSDLPIAEKCRSVLEKFDVSFEIRVASAHRAPKYLEQIISNAEDSGCQVLHCAVSDNSLDLASKPVSTTHQTLPTSHVG